MNTSQFIICSFILCGCIIQACDLDNNATELIEFRKTYYHLDSTYYTCVKSIPGLGNIVLEGNARLNGQNNVYGLSLVNFTDTIGWRLSVGYSYGLNEAIGIKFSPLKNGKFEVSNGELNDPYPSLAVGALNKFDSDSPLATYIVDTREENYFELTSIDTIHKIAEGKFELHFILTDRHSDAADNFAKQISFTNGIFIAKVTF